MESSAFNLESMHIWSARQDNRPIFLEWYAKQRLRHGFEKIKKALEPAIKKAGANADLLINDLFISCWCAQQAAEEGDPWKATRKELSDADQNKQPVITAAKVLRNYLKGYPGINMTCLLRIRPEAMRRGIHISDKENRPSHVVLGELADVIASGLDQHTIGHGSGPFIHLTDIGCLVYPGGVSVTNIPPTRTQLAFSLVFYMRLWTSAPEDRPSMGWHRQMPKSGRPFYSVVAEIVDFVLGDYDSYSQKKINTDSVKNAIPRLVKKGVKFNPWPQRWMNIKKG
jgi:hypothetical protein